MLHRMQEGDMLELVREPENKHDTCAVALRYNMKKIGYIPRAFNALTLGDRETRINLYLTVNKIIFISYN